MPDDFWSRLLAGSGFACSHERVCPEPERGAHTRKNKEQQQHEVADLENGSDCVGAMALSAGTGSPSRW
jgi:hypothetical protein